MAKRKKFDRSVVGEARWDLSVAQRHYWNKPSASTKRALSAAETALLVAVNVKKGRKVKRGAL